MATVTAGASLTIATTWDVNAVLTRLVGGGLTVTAQRDVVVSNVTAASLTVTATATAGSTVIHTVDADLVSTATPTGDMTGVLLGNTGLNIFVSPTVVANNFTYTPSPYRTAHIESEDRTAVVVNDPKRYRSSPMLIRFTKDPDAVLDYTLSFTDWLPGGDTVINSVVTPDAGITATSSSFTTTTSTVWLSGGTDGTTYKVIVHVTTAAGRQDDHVMFIKVEDKGLLV